MKCLAGCGHKDTDRQLNLERAKTENSCFVSVAFRRLVAVMTQLRFTLYTVNPSNRPLVRWLDNPPLPLSDLKSTATDPGFDPKNPHSHSAGILQDAWHIHQAGCLVIA